MGYKHTREDLLDAALAVARDDGLSQLTYGRVARRLGINDRVVVYYFPSKEDLVGDVLVAVGAELQATLADAVTTRAADHRALVRAAWPLLATPRADPTFALFFEAIGLAAAGRPPYDTLVPRLLDAWVDWAAAHLAGAPARRRAEAEAAIALVDGLLLVRLTAGPAAADRAARRLGVT